MKRLSVVPIQNCRDVKSFQYEFIQSSCKQFQVLGLKNAECSPKLIFCSRANYTSWRYWNFCVVSLFEVVIWKRLVSIPIDEKPGKPYPFKSILFSPGIHWLISPSKSVHTVTASEIRTKCRSRSPPQPMASDHYFRVILEYF